MFISVPVSYCVVQVWKKVMLLNVICFLLRSDEEDDDDDDVSSTVSNLSNVSGLSDISGQDWKPIAGTVYTTIIVYGSHLLT